jgi:hypothetical protein
VVDGVREACAELFAKSEKVKRLAAAITEALDDIRRERSVSV